MIAKGYDIAIVARAVDLPKILMVRSIAKTTKGNENADQVSLKFKNSIPDRIEPKSNRFVWVNPNVWHGIEVVNNLANINRITVVAWPAGSIEYDSADIIINNL